MEELRKNIIANIEELKNQIKHFITFNEEQSEEITPKTKNKKIVELFEFIKNDITPIHLDELLIYANDMCKKIAYAHNTLTHEENISITEKLILKNLMQTTMVLKNYCEKMESEIKKSSFAIEEYTNKILTLENSIKNIEADFKNTKLGFENIKISMEGKIEETKDSYDKTINDLKQKDLEVSELVKLVTEKSISGDFEKTAIDEKNIANKFRASVLTLMAFMLAMALYTFFETIGQDFDFKHSLFRMFLVFVMLIPITYLAKESSKHRDQQQNHHEKNLILKAVDPYIRNLPEQEKYKIKYEIANRIFSVRNSTTSLHDTTQQLPHLIDSIIKALKKSDEK